MFFRFNAAVEPDFIQIPELKKSQVRNQVKWIAERYRDRDLPTYGAFVVRAGGVNLAKGAIRTFQKVQKSAHPIKDTNIRFTPKTYRRGSDGELHRDTGRSNALTAHVTLQGSVDFVMLLDPKMANSWSLIDRDRELGSELIDHGTLEGEPATNALATVLNPGDVILFDHSHVHAFRSRDLNRHSTAYWMD